MTSLLYGAGAAITTLVDVGAAATLTEYLTSYGVTNTITGPHTKSMVVFASSREKIDCVESVRKVSHMRVTQKAR